LHRAPLQSHQAEDILGKHVVFGHGNNITGLVKSAAQVHKVTPQAWRTYDSINFAIKSFQTIFRLPFHIGNLSSGVFQANLAGASPKNLAASYYDTMRFLFGSERFSSGATLVTDLMDVNTNVVSKGMLKLFSNRRNGLKELHEATRLHGGGEFTKYLKQQKPEVLDALDQVEDITIPLRDGGEINMREFVEVAGEMQLYGTFASSLTRGSRTTAENLLRIKLSAMDPTMGGKLKGLPKRLHNRLLGAAETSEIINRTATALALAREGHPLRRAIEIAKDAHVPYERLTPFEKNGIKRVSLYYSFPRHYMPWAWTKFGEDPKQLSAAAGIIRDQKMVTTDEGQANLKAGDYRINLSRLNANVEAAGLLAAFADRFALPAMGTARLTDENADTRKLVGQPSDAGLFAVGGVPAAVFGTSSMFSDPQREPSSHNFFQEAAQLAYPVKMLNVMLGNQPAKAERSPYVQYTSMESWLTDEVLGVGARKVREEHELVRSKLSFRRAINQLRLRAAATEDAETKDRYIQSAKSLAEGLHAAAGRSEQKLY
jgi:hypothetical protein